MIVLPFCGQSIRPVRAMMAQNDYFDYPGNLMNDDE